MARHLATMAIAMLPVVATTMGSSADTCNYPGGSCYMLNLDTCHKGPTAGKETIHGLWPQWTSNCPGPKFDMGLMTSILPEMHEKWPSCPELQHDVEKFWGHEWQKHGLCTGFDQLAYFKTALSLYDTYAKTCASTSLLCETCFTKDLNNTMKCGGNSPKPHPHPTPGSDPTKASCNAIGCHQPMNKSSPCQCNDQCKEHSDCCSDYESVCFAPRPKPSPSSPHPNPQPSHAPAPPKETCNYPGGHCYMLNLDTCLTGPTAGKETIHGLWPQWKSNCPGAKFNMSLMTSILPEMNKKWLSCPEHGGDVEKFWTHEWEKHGSCTGFDQLTYFKTALSLYDIYAKSCASEHDLCETCLTKDLKSTMKCGGDSPQPHKHHQHHRPQTSCKAIGCHHPLDEASPCQCDDQCKEHSDCCSDYDSVCAGSTGRLFVV